jgi:hypothetical protein
VRGGGDKLVESEVVSRMCGSDQHCENFTRRRDGEGDSKGMDNGSNSVKRKNNQGETLNEGK